MATLTEFRYEAANLQAGGSTVRGSMEASSRAAAIGKLKAQGLAPLVVEEAATTGLNREIHLPGFTKHVKLKSLSILSRQFATLIRAGLPLMRALNILVEQTDDKVLKQALTQVQVDVGTGLSFSAALQKQSDVFPPLFVNMMRVGEMGGFMDRTAEAVAATYESEVQLREKIRSASTYPAVVAIISVLAVLGIVTFIVPIFESMFDQLGGTLPLPTRILVVLSHNMAWILPVLLVLVIVGAIAWRRYRYEDAVRRVVDPWKLKIPVFGKLFTKVALARFSRNLSMLLSAGVPLLQTLDVVGQASANWVIQDAVADIRESVSGGKSFSAPLSRHSIFPELVVQMAAVGEESGSLPDMLESVAKFYDQEVKTAADQLTSTIEPILIVVLGIIIGGMVISLYLPIFSLYGQLNQS